MKCCAREYKSDFLETCNLNPILSKSVPLKTANLEDARTNSALRPWLASLLLTTVFFLLHLLVFRPGYQVDDDITMISLASGYLGGKPVPFLIFSNVILGFLLNILYRLPTSLNWEILFFIALNFFSTWCLIHLVLSFPLRLSEKIIGALAVLLADSYFLLSITFTMIAAFSAIAGFCSMLAAARQSFPAGKRFYFFGGVLIFVSGLIRIESVILVSLTIGLSIILMYRLFDYKSLVIAFAGVGLLVLGSSLFNKFYVQAYPEWQAFYAYSDTRSLIQDTPRIRYQDKFKNISQQIGWSPIDTRMFTGWFIADEQVFSLDNLRYLVNRLPGTDSNLLGAVLSYFYPHTDPVELASISYPYALMLIAAFLSVAIYSSLRKAALPLLAILFSIAFLFVYLLWTQKVPPRVWYSFLATLVVFGYFCITWSKTNAVSPEWNIVERLGSVVVSSLVLAALALTISRAVLVSAVNIEKQNAYKTVLSNLNSLQAQGKIQQDALIVIPALGIPMEWANPMTLDFPKIQVLELGWLAFSPPYRDVLQHYDSYPLLTGLYEKDNVYLMTRANLIGGIVQFVQLHTGAVVQADPVFIVNYPGIDNGAYINTVLYKFRLVK